MGSFSSLTTVVGLWLGVSFGLWLIYRFIRRRGHAQHRKLLAEALRLIDEAGAVFGALRKAPLSGTPSLGATKRSQAQQEELLREDVRALLNSIAASSGFFERVNACKRRIQATFKLEEYLPLSEILQIRRDFWAASEVFLIEDIRLLGAELADDAALEAFRQEAKVLLFGEEAAPDAEHPDPVKLRLGIAREQALAFEAEIERIISRQREEDRFPTARELFALPWQAIRSGRGLLREFGGEIRAAMKDAIATAGGLAHVMASKGLRSAAEELRRIRGSLPDQFATAFERAGGLARQGGHQLKRHYEFLIEAQELRARYAEFLAKAPELTERGKQFLARLEFEKRAEQFRETSEGALAWARRQMVLAIAYLIRALQYLQAKITPMENKQLIAQPPASPVGASSKEQKEAASDPVSAMPIRALLPPAPLNGKAHGKDGTKGRASRQRGKDKDARSGQSLKAEAEETVFQARAKPRFSHTEGMMKTSFRELLAEAEPEEESGSERPVREAGAQKSGSLLERLSAIEAEAASGADEKGAQHSSRAERKRRFPFFR
jgi:hypothetical protein